MTFGLNALRGRHQISHTVWGGDWDPSNAKDFINYTISKGYKIDSWEFGRIEDKAVCYIQFCFIGSYSCMMCYR